MFLMYISVHIQDKFLKITIHWLIIKEFSNIASDMDRLIGEFHVLNVHYTLQEDHLKCLTSISNCEYISK